MVGPHPRPYLCHPSILVGDSNWVISLKMSKCRLTKIIIPECWSLPYNFLKFVLFAQYPNNYIMT